MVYQSLIHDDDLENMKTTGSHEKSKRCKPVNDKPTKIAVYDRSGKLVEICNSIKETVKKYKVNQDTIRNHCTNKIKHHVLDYKFQYA